MQIELIRMQKTQQRNWNIMRLRGILGRLNNLLPDDVRALFTKEELLKWNETNKNILKALDHVKKSTNCKNCWKRRKVDSEGLCNECRMD